MEDTATRKAMSCHINGLPCIEGIREDFKKDAHGHQLKCRQWVHLYGKDPQSEKMIDQFDCSFAWVPVTTIEGSQMTRQLTSTLDAHRSEMQQNFGQVAKAVTDGLRAVASRPITIISAPAVPQIENGGSKS